MIYIIAGLSLLMLLSGGFGYIQYKSAQSMKADLARCAEANTVNQQTITQLKILESDAVKNCDTRLRDKAAFDTKRKVLQQLKGGMDEKALVGDDAILNALNRMWK